MSTTSTTTTTNNHTIAKSLTKITHINEHNPHDAFTTTTTTNILTPMEAESIIKSLQSVTVEEIGSSKFLHLYAVQLERLSLQAHASAQQNNNQEDDINDGEFVLEAILTFHKLDVLVTTLLAIEAWRTFVLDSRCGGTTASSTTTTTTTAAGEEGSLLLGLVAKNGNSLRCAFILHVEATLVGLLNLIMYRRERCEAMTCEAAIALCDYCARQLTSLAIPVPANKMVRRQKEPEPIEQMTKRLQTRTTKDEIQDTRIDTEYKIAVVTTSLARHLCEHIESLPMAAQSRILDTHDFLVLFVPLIEEPPWTRRRLSSKTGSIIWEKQMDNYEWKEVDPSDLLQITKCEAQCWLAIFHLTCSDLCRKGYALNEFRKGQLLRLRKFLHDVILDQLPVLRDVMRYMDELSITSVPDNASGHGSALLMEQVDVFRESLLVGRDWDQVARDQFESVFSKVTDAHDEDLRLIADIYNEETIGCIVGTADVTNVFESLHSPLEDISISFYNSDGSCHRECYVLTQKGDGKEIQTPHGRFQRIKLKILQMDDDLSLPGNVEVEAKIRFKGPPKFTKILSSPNIALALPIDGSPKIQWSQLGTLEENLVLQLGFKGFALDQAYLTQSLPN